ncbi:DUF7674 family protein [Methylovulum miyakonense]|uniref:DUF7674 family protein n=1 Tax=Methylovulum miyakonense TaxID=645578 RepID=UPI0003829DF7|nr:hypothetical protein [Methylovulum miyakonense]
MQKDQEIAKFIDEIRDKFPDVSIQIDKWMLRQGLEPEDKWYWDMMEAFSQATTDAIKNSDEQLALSHLSFVSEKLKIASKIEEEFIDVYYVESLMWDIKDKEKLKWGWSLIPENLKELYKETWGEPDF